MGSGRQLAGQGDQLTRGKGGYPLSRPSAEQGIPSSLGESGGGAASGGDAGNSGVEATMAAVVGPQEVGGFVQIAEVELAEKGRLIMFNSAIHSPT